MCNFSFDDMLQAVLSGQFNKDVLISTCFILCIIVIHGPRRAIRQPRLFCVECFYLLQSTSNLSCYKLHNCQTFREYECNTPVMIPVVSYSAAKISENKTVFHP